MPWPAASTAPLSADRLRELVDYDPATGIFRRRVSTSPRALAGQVCGDLDSKGYVRLRVDKKRYLAHRLAWLYTHGAWPEDQIDHINGERTDNRISNLRPATNTENLRNSSGRARSASGLKGVSVACGNGRWRARIRAEGREKQIGVFSSEQEAKAAYDAAAKAAFGDFARAG